MVATVRRGRRCREGGGRAAVPGRPGGPGAPQLRTAPPGVLHGQMDRRRFLNTPSPDQREPSTWRTQAPASDLSPVSSPRWSHRRSPDAQAWGASPSSPPGKPSPCHPGHSGKLPSRARAQVPSTASPGPPPGAPPSGSPNEGITPGPGDFQSQPNPSVTPGACYRRRSPGSHPPPLPGDPGVPPLESRASTPGFEAGVAQPAVRTVPPSSGGSGRWWGCPRSSHGPGTSGQQGTLTRTRACPPAPETCRFHGSRTGCGSPGSR